MNQAATVRHQRARMKYGDNDDNASRMRIINVAFTTVCSRCSCEPHSDIPSHTHSRSVGVHIATTAPAQRTHTVHQQHTGYRLSCSLLIHKITVPFRHGKHETNKLLNTSRFFSFFSIHSKEKNSFVISTWNHIKKKVVHHIAMR